jgi:PiT family inorganic phosphate transporter
VNTEALEVIAPSIPRPQLDRRPGPASPIIFIALLTAGLIYTAYSLATDISQSGFRATSVLPYCLLGIALLIALGFEFVNGFHDTANAVATVIYTHSLPPHVAVLWSGLFNFLGVMRSSGTVAFSFITLLPVELILQVGSSAGFAMVFALLIAAIIWNLGTWWLGLPASSSHTLIGSIVGVGIANALMHGRNGTSGVDWTQVTKIGETLLISPIVGFVASALLLWVMRAVIKKPELFAAPKGNQPPPWGIRSLLVLTCTGVSFAHGSNDGQKGLGLIMLILVGTVPLTYALNRAMPNSNVTQFVAVAQATQQSLMTGLSADARARAQTMPLNQARGVLETFVRTRQYQPQVAVALADLSGMIGTEVKQDGSSLAHVPAGAVNNVRNDMYLTSEAIRIAQTKPAFQPSAEARANLKAFKQGIDAATKFIPPWVKVAVAIALGLGTMVGWKRIVVTVGEKIGKSHLTYGQGAAAEIVAMLTISAADSFGLPVSTTHVLSSGVAGTMAASGAGVQMSTVRSLALAWVLTLPAAILLSAGLYWLLAHLF